MSTRVVMSVENTVVLFNKYLRRIEVLKEENEDLTVEQVVEMGNKGEKAERYEADLTLMYNAFVGGLVQMGVIAYHSTDGEFGLEFPPEEETRVLH